LVTGNIYADADPNDAAAGNIPLAFKHEGIVYEVHVWSEAALDEFARKRGKYMAKIIANSQ